MSNTIVLTTNLPLQFTPYKIYDIEQLKIYIEKAGYVPKVIQPQEMHIPLDEVPYAVINCTNYPTETHLRFVRNLELKGAKVANPIFSSRIADDKMLSFIEMHNAGIPVPMSIDLNLGYGLEFGRIINHINNTIGFPVVVKVPNSALGYGVHKVDSIDQFDEVINLLAQCNQRHNLGHMSVNLLVQQLVKETAGRAVRVVVLGGKCIGAYQRTNSKNWKTAQSSQTWKYGMGGLHEDPRTPFEITPEVEEICLKVSSVLNLNLVGIDLLFGPSGFMVGEVNTSPNHEPFDKTQGGNNLAEMLVRYLVS